MPDLFDRTDDITQSRDADPPQLTGAIGLSIEVSLAIGVFATFGYFLTAPAWWTIADVLGLTLVGSETAWGFWMSSVLLGVGAFVVAEAYRRLRSVMSHAARHRRQQ